jgi:phosphoribosyl-AMP cyclohydrolase
MGNDWLNMVKWTDERLVPAIAQDAQDGTILMVAWMNREALDLTAREGRAVYWSRSRRKLWRKGEESGHEQLVKEIRLDCHTGRRSCFFQRLESDRWVTVEPVLKDPDVIYSKQTD